MLTNTVNVDIFCQPNLVVLYKYYKRFSYAPAYSTEMLSIADCVKRN